MIWFSWSYVIPEHRQSQDYVLRTAECSQKPKTITEEKNVPLKEALWEVETNLYALVGGKFTLVVGLVVETAYVWSFIMSSFINCDDIIKNKFKKYLTYLNSLYFQIHVAIIVLNILKPEWELKIEEYSLVSSLCAFYLVSSVDKEKSLKLL